MKRSVAIALSLMLMLSLCACGSKAASQPDAVPSAGAEATGEALDAQLDEIFKDAEVQVTLPEDNGMAGVYKWVEMED